MSRILKTLIRPTTYPSNRYSLVLGIETSCDETAVGVVRYPKLTAVANVLNTQIPLHAPFFGVVPELASRAHLENITGVLSLAFKKALLGDLVSLGRLEAVAYTQGPGLKGALMVGENAAKALALALGRPAIGVHHLEAHLAAILLEKPQVTPPFLGLVVSGGHTDLVHVKRWGSYRVLGRTLDDACGEAFDKFAKMLRLGYPGGPAVDRLAKKGNPRAIIFPRPVLKGTWNFSFSGLKTSALYWIRDHGRPRSRQGLCDLAAGFQEAIVETLLTKTRNALSALRLNTVVVAGGVGANSRLRELFQESARQQGWLAYFPSPALCTDNGAMIAVAGALRLMSGAKLSSRNADSLLPFPSW